MLPAIPALAAVCFLHRQPAQLFPQAPLFSAELRATLLSLNYIFAIQLFRQFRIFFGQLECWLLWRETLDAQRRFCLFIVLRDAPKGERHCTLVFHSEIPPPTPSARCTQSRKALKTTAGSDLVWI